MGERSPHGKIFRGNPGNTKHNKTKHKTKNTQNTTQHITQTQRNTKHITMQNKTKTEHNAKCKIQNIRKRGIYNGSVGALQMHL